MENDLKKTCDIVLLSDININKTAKIKVGKLMTQNNAVRKGQIRVYILTAIQHLNRSNTRLRKKWYRH